MGTYNFSKDIFAKETKLMCFELKYTIMSLQVWVLSALSTLKRA